MENLKTLNLQEKDFKMIIDALEAYPLKDMAGEMLMDILKLSLSEKPDREKILRERRILEEKRSREQSQAKDDIKILQGKILMLKRLLIENKIMEDVKDIYNKN